MQKGCELEVFALKLGATLGVLAVDPLALEFKESFFAFVRDLETIAQKFCVDLTLPTTYSPDEEETFRILRALALNEPMNLKNFTTRLIKSAENAAVVPQQFREEMVFRMEHDSVKATLFGTNIDVGPTVIQIERAKVERLPETLQAFAKAKMGTAVPISLRPLSPVQFQSVKPELLLSARKGT